MTSCAKIVTSLYFFPIYLEQFGTWIPDAQSVKLIVSLIVVTFYLTKTERRTRKSLTQLSNCCFEALSKGSLFAKKNPSFQHNSNVFQTGEVIYRQALLRTDKRSPILYHSFFVTALEGAILIVWKGAILITSFVSFNRQFSSCKKICIILRMLLFLSIKRTSFAYSCKKE